MNYALLINDDNSVIATNKKMIMQREKLVSNLVILVAAIYENSAMADYDMLYTIKLPSGKSFSGEVTSRDLNYKPGYIKYELPIDTKMTCEKGDIEIQFLFVKTDINDEGKLIQQSRQIDPYYLHINEIADYCEPSDEQLSWLAQLYLNNKQQLLALDKLASAFENTKIDDIILDTTDMRLYGTSNGKRIGNGIDLTVLADELTEIAGNSHGNISIKQM